MRRDIRARSNRMVSCGSQERCAPSATFRAMLSSAGCAGRAINLLRGRRGQGQPRAFLRRDLDIETIAAGDAAGGIDEHRRQPVAFRRGKAHAQRAGFMQDAAARHAVDRAHVEGDRAAGAVGRKHRCAESFGPHPPLGARLLAAARNDQSAICRLISAGSRLARSQAYFTAPRSMTAKLSPSSQAKSRYCSTSTMAMLPRLRR